MPPRLYCLASQGPSSSQEIHSKVKAVLAKSLKAVPPAREFLTEATDPDFPGHFLQNKDKKNFFFFGPNTALSLIIGSGGENSSDARGFEHKLRKSGNCRGAPQEGWSIAYGPLIRYNPGIY